METNKKFSIICFILFGSACSIISLQQKSTQSSSKTKSTNDTNLNTAHTSTASIQNISDENFTNLIIYNLTTLPTTQNTNLNMYGETEVHLGVSKSPTQSMPISPEAIPPAALRPLALKLPGMMGAPSLKMRENIEVEDVQSGRLKPFTLGLSRPPALAASEKPSPLKHENTSSQTVTLNIKNAVNMSDIRIPPPVEDGVKYLVSAPHGFAFSSEDQMMSGFFYGEEFGSNDSIVVSNRILKRIQNSSTSESPLYEASTQKVSINSEYFNSLANTLSTLTTKDSVKLAGFQNKPYNLEVQFLASGGGSNVFSVTVKNKNGLSHSFAFKLASATKQSFADGAILAKFQGKDNIMPALGFSRNWVIMPKMKSDLYDFSGPFTPNNFQRACVGFKNLDFYHRDFSAGNVFFDDSGNIVFGDLDKNNGTAFYSLNTVFELPSLRSENTDAIDNELLREEQIIHAYGMVLLQLRIPELRSSLVDLYFQTPTNISQAEKSAFTNNKENMARMKVDGFDEKLMTDYRYFLEKYVFAKHLPDSPYLKENKVTVVAKPLSDSNPIDVFIMDLLYGKINRAAFWDRYLSTLK